MKRLTAFLLLPVLFMLLHCNDGLNHKPYSIKKGAFMATLSESGELEAVHSRVMTIPFIGWQYGYRLKLTGLKEHGDIVATGDSIAQVDPQSVFKVVMEKKNQLAVEEAAMNKLKVEHQNRYESFAAELATAKASLDLNKIQLDKYQFEPGRKREIQALEYQKAQIGYEKVQRRAEFAKQVMENELIIQVTKIVQVQNEIEDAQHALSRLTIYSPLDGMLQLLKNRRTDQTIRIGDEVHQGARFASIPDMREMRVKAKVNETDIGKIYLQQSVEIRLDAFPKRLFKGKISKIGKLSYREDPNDLSKVFDVQILMDESDPVLKPGMTVRCDIIVANLDDVFFVENECIYKDDQSYYLLIGNKRVNVKVGARNYLYSVIQGDLKQGQRATRASERAES